MRSLIIDNTINVAPFYLGNDEIAMPLHTVDVIGVKISRSENGKRMVHRFEGGRMLAAVRSTFFNGGHNFRIWQIPNHYQMINAGRNQFAAIKIEVNGADVITMRIETE